MNKSFNKRKNNNNKFDKSPENFKINMNNINNLGNHNYEKGIAPIILNKSVKACDLAFKSN